MKGKPKTNLSIDTDNINKEHEEYENENFSEPLKETVVRDKIKKVPSKIIALMVLLFLFTLYVHIIRPASTILEIIYLARMTKAPKLDNADYYDKAITHFITELNGYYKNQDKFKCFTFDLETGEAEITTRCDANPTKRDDVHSFLTDTVVAGFPRYFRVLEDLEKRLEIKKLNNEKLVTSNGIQEIRKIEEDGLNLQKDDTSHLTFYRRLVTLKDYFEEIKDQISTKNVKKTLIFVGWIFMFVLPIPSFIIYGVRTIYYQENVWASIWATIVSLIEVFMNFPLVFLYPDDSSSVYLFTNRGFEHLLANWLIFFPTNYLTSIYENIRQIAESILLFILCLKSYNKLTDNYFENFTESFLLIIMIFNAIRVFCSVILIFIGIWRRCTQRELLQNKVNEIKQKEKEEREKKETIANENSTPRDKPTDKPADKAAGTDKKNN